MRKARALKWNQPTTTPEYYAWRNMRRRCYNPSDDSYGHYGGRGITVCERWANDFDAFVRDMGQAPTGKSLDRIDVNGNYAPENCRWATDVEQMRNQRRNVLITLGTETVCIAEWAEKLGVRADTLAGRLSRMSPEKALVSGSIKPKWKHGSRAGYEIHKCKCEECRASNATRHRKARARRKIND